MESSGGEKAEDKTLWMNSAAEVIEDLCKEGIPVVGFNWWPLYETIQWEYRDNSKSVMECIYNGGWNNGLYLIKEHLDGTLERVPTDAVKAYKELIERVKLI